jgi:hypothetical protein
MLGLMSPRPLQRRPPASRSSASRRKKTKPGWLTWLPLLVGIAVAPLARRAADVLALEGPAALQTLYPYVALLKLHVLGLPGEFAASLSQWMMWLQFPLYGLFMSLLMRVAGVARSLIATVLLHVLPLVFLISIAKM